MGEHGGQSGECIVSADSDTRDSSIGKDKNGIDGIDMFLDQGRNTFLVELVLLKTTSVSQSRGVEDANLGKMLCTLTMFTNLGAYHDAVLALKFVNAGGVRLALVAVIVAVLLVGMVESVKVIIISVIAGKNIGD